ncbi:MAG: methyltransferase domain-containing protein [Bacteroidota bacterium]
MNLAVEKNITEDAFAYFEDLLSKKGPEIEEFSPLNELINFLYEAKDEELTQLVRQRLVSIYHLDTIMGWMFKKPYGYAGDFKIIDMIYQHKVSSNPAYFRWDIFVNNQVASKAVRNRKTYFKNLLLKKTLEHKGMLKILNLASGPARDLYEFFEENPNAEIHCTCVELDSHAIEFAKDLLQDHLDKVTFINKNIFRFQTQEKYDLIWSAGLFDYFEDKVFVRLLSRLKNNLANNGEIVIGNFHPRNETRPMMELLGDWYLNHRTKDELTQLADEAGIVKGCIKIEAEPEGINLFMRMAQ